MFRLAPFLIGAASAVYLRSNVRLTKPVCVGRSHVGSLPVKLNGYKHGSVQVSQSSVHAVSSLSFYQEEPQCQCVPCMCFEARSPPKCEHLQSSGSQQSKLEEDGTHRAKVHLHRSRSRRWQHLREVLESLAKEGRKRV